MEKYVLFGNATLWVLAFLFWFRRKGIYNVGVFILLIYAMISCFSCHLFLNPETSSFYERYIFIIPFLYLFIIILFLLKPLLKIDYSKISEIRLPSQKVINPICIYIIISSLYQLTTGWQDIKYGFSLMLLDSSNAVDLYLDTTEANMARQSLSGSFNIIGIMVTTATNFSMLFFYLYLLYPIKNKMMIVGLIFSVMSLPVMSIASGSREKIVTSLLMFVLMYLFLKPFFDKQIRKTISIVSLSLFSFLLMFFVIVSFARARGDIEGVLTGFESYFGMSFLKFDQNCFYLNGTREGNLVSPLLNVILGGQTYSQEALRAKYANLDIDNGVFYTFIGDFTLDYGPIFAFLILVFFAIYCRRLTNNRIWSGGQIVLGYILLKLLSGFYLHQFSGIGGNLLVIELFVFYYLFSKGVIPSVTIKHLNNDEKN